MPQNEAEASTVTSNISSTITKTDRRTSWYIPLCQVTKTSRILAILVMIILPFVGGYVGWQYGLSASLQAPLVSNSPTQNSIETIDVSQYSAEELAQFLKSKEEFDLKILQQNLQKKIEGFIGTSTLPVDDQTVKSHFGHGWMVYQPSSESKYLLSAQVNYKDEQAKQAATKPYFTFVTQVGAETILTLGCFKATECTFSGLYKFDTATNELSTMQSGSLYVPMYTGGVLSPDNTKIALSPYREYSTLGTEVGYIDLLSDTYHNLSSLDVSDNNRFTICEMGCSPEISWLSNTRVAATQFSYSSCGGGNECISDYKTEDGDTGGTTAPISSSTKTFDI